MATLDDAALWREARQERAAEEQPDMQDLLDSQESEHLSTDDIVRLETLLDTYGRLMVRKASAGPARLSYACRAYHPYRCRWFIGRR